MGKIADLFFQALMDDKRLQLDAKKSGDKAGATLGSSMAAAIKKSWSGEQLGKGLVQGLGFAGALGAANLLTSGIHSLTGALGDSIEAAKEEELSVAKLGAALQANVKGWDGNTSAIEEALQARMRLGFADDEQRDSLALLVAATHDAAKALDLQRTAMDLARLKGISLKDASEALVKVEGGQFRLLKSLGIELKKGATQTEALAAVTKVAGGQAEAYAETSGGKMLASQIKVGEAMEKLGTTLLPIAAEGLSLLADAAVEVIGPLSDVMSLFTGSAPTIDDYRRKLDELENTTGLLGRDEGSIAKLREQIRFLEDQASAAAGGGYFSRLGDQVTDFAQTAVDRAEEVATALPNALDSSRRRSVAIAAKTPGEIAEALRTGRVLWQDAVDQLGTDLENEMSRTAEIAALQGFLAGDQLAKGLGSTDPIVAAQAEETKRLAEARLLKLVQDARKYGRDTGLTFAAGLESTQHKVESAASKLAGAVGSYLKVSSPAEKGPLSTLGGPEGWGERFAAFLARGISSGLPDINRVIGSGLAMPSLGGAVALPSAGAPFRFADAPAPSGDGGDRSITINASGISERDTPLRIADAVRRAQRVQRLSPAVQRVLRSRG